MRHAKSSWKHDELSDYERPLNKRGRKATPLIAELLHDRGLRPEIVVSSSAERAKQTAELLLATWQADIPLVLSRNLYLAGPPRYLEVLAEFANNAQTAMVIGHNPGIEYLIEQLTGEDEWMPTAAVAIIEIRGSWKNPIDCRLQDVIRPRELAA